MLTTNIERIGSNTVIDLDEKDLLSNDLIRSLSHELSKISTRSAVINLEQISALSSREWGEVVALVNALRLIGIRAVLCGINPSVAMTLIELVDSPRVESYLNVDGALDALEAE
ncbi:MAG TPA: hypothetical protein VLA39_11200 [Marinobacterium sp.]|nr:hypothetical protein [Marinobacterium sp.]